MLNKNITKYREKKGYSMYKLSTIAGIEYATLLYMEKGKKKNPTLETLKSLSKALDVSIEELIK